MDSLKSVVQVACDLRTELSYVHVSELGYSPPDIEIYMNLARDGFENSRDAVFVVTSGKNKQTTTTEEHLSLCIGREKKKML